MSIRIGAQLYTLRKDLKKTENFDAVFARVAQMGAQCVQVSGTCAFQSGMMRELSNKYNLPVCITHSPFERIRDDLDNLAKEHLDYGCPIIGIGMMPFSYSRKKTEDIKQFTEFLNQTAKKLKPYGLKIAYHNHAFELKQLGGVRILDFLLDNTAEEVLFTPDTYWLKVGGVDPAEYITRMKGRVGVVHLKDYDKGWPLAKMKEVGAGTFDFRAILDAAEQSGATDAVVELDFARKPYEALENSLKYLLAL